jgi:hypothetical protein
MANLLKLRIGVSDDPTAYQPTLNDCLETMMEQAEPLMADVLHGLAAATAPSEGRRAAELQRPGVKDAVNALAARSKDACASFRSELTRVVYEGGGKEQVQTELLRFEDLRLFEDEQLDQSIELARAQHEVSLAVDDVLPALDALISTLLGWRTTQPGLNPLRPDSFVRALQATLSLHVPDGSVRESLITPAAGLLGVHLRKLYRQLTELLRSSGVEPAVPLGGRLHKGAGAVGVPVADAMSKTLLTLDRLRKLLAGDFDPQVPARDFMLTVPASMAMLQDMDQVDVLVEKLERRPRPEPPEPPADMLAAAEPCEPGPALPRLGLQLGEEVVRLMFDNLAHDGRLLPEFKRQLRLMEPAVFKLAQQDSRFFSERTHPARQFLDRITQRSLAFSAEHEPGWRRFLVTVEEAVQWLDSKVVDAATFSELVEHLQASWAGHDQTVRQRGEEAARALLHAEQRNLLAQKLAAEFGQALEGLDVADFVGDFLKGSWAQVVAQAKLSCVDGSDDPHGYRAMVDDLIWSVQKSTATRGRARRLVQMIPGLLEKVREGLSRIEYPPELTARFFNNLITIHRAAVHEGRDAVSKAAADAAEAQQSEFSDSMQEAALWLDSREAQESGYLPEDALEPQRPASLDAMDDGPARAAEMRPGTWVELFVRGEWVRAQLTWSSPHSTLLMFTSQSGSAHSMSRRTLDRLRARGEVKVIAERNVVEEALDQVAKAALKNSLDGA